MPTEQEELKLVITLDDHASAQLGKLQSQLTGMGETATKTTGKTKEITVGVQGLGAALGTAGRTMGFWASMTTAAIDELEKFGKELIGRATDFDKLSRTMNETAMAASRMGTSTAQLELNFRAFRRVGVSVEDATKNLANFSDAMADLSLVNGQLRANLLSGGFLSLNDMLKVLQQSDQSKTVEKQIDVWRKAANEVNRYWTSLAGPTTGAMMRRRFLEAIQAPELDRMTESLTRASAAQIELFEQRSENSKEFLKNTTDISIGWERITESIGHSLIRFDNMIGSSRTLANILNDIADVFERHEQKGFGKSLEDFWTSPDPSERAGTLGRMYMRYRNFRAGVANMPTLEQAGKTEFWQGPTREMLERGGAQRFGNMADYFGGIRLTEGWDRMMNDPTNRAMGRANIEDRRTTEENTEETEKLTGELKRLNDYLTLYPPGAEDIGEAGMSQLARDAGINDIGRRRGGIGGVGRPGTGSYPGGFPGTGGAPGPGGTPGPGDGTGAVPGPGGGLGGLGPGGATERGPLGRRVPSFDAERPPPPGSTQQPGTATGPDAPGTIPSVGPGAGRLGATSALAAGSAIGGPLGPVLGIGARTGGLAGGLSRGFNAPEGGPASSQTGGGGGAGYLAARRQRFMDEMNRDPMLKKRVAAIASLEHESDPTAVVESLMNRQDYTGRSIRQGLGIDRPSRSFYGPVRKGLLDRRVAELERNPRRMKRMMDAIDRAGAGSNLIRGATDQGSPTDPNARWPGGRIMRHGEVYNDWGGGPGGHAGAARYRENLMRGMREAEARADAQVVRANVNRFYGVAGAGLGGGVGTTMNVDGTPVGIGRPFDETRGSFPVLDQPYGLPPEPYDDFSSRFGQWGGSAGKITGNPYGDPSWGGEGISQSEFNRRFRTDGSRLDRGQRVDVNGRGTLDVNVNAPAGTTVRGRGDGLLKDMPINRSVQMEPAERSPLADAGEGGGGGKG